jgi:hypothetical protein
MRFAVRYVLRCAKANVACFILAGFTVRRATGLFCKQLVIERVPRASSLKDFVTALHKNKLELDSIHL